MYVYLIIIIIIINNKIYDCIDYYSLFNMLVCTYPASSVYI